MLPRAVTRAFQGCLVLMVVGLFVMTTDLSNSKGAKVVVPSKRSSDHGSLDDLHPKPSEEKAAVKDIQKTEHKSNTVFSAAHVPRGRERQRERTDDKPTVDLAAVTKTEAEVASSSSDNKQCIWRPETIAGSCVGGTAPTRLSKQQKTAEECEAACCSLPAVGAERCVLWQFRKSSGCLFGGDSRIGMEKDGIPAWCEPNPPSEWHGQRLQVHEDSNREEACGEKWNPKELQGQCFGLGPRRTLKEETASACRDACCADAKCQTWQWREDVGCYYADKSVSRCDNPNHGPFQGRRKYMPNRTYTPPWKEGVKPFKPY